jgi:hypothetical protein
MDDSSDICRRTKALENVAIAEEMAKMLSRICLKARSFVAEYRLVLVMRNAQIPNQVHKNLVGCGRWDQYQSPETPLGRVHEAIQKQSRNPCDFSMFIDPHVEERHGAGDELSSARGS